MTLAAMKNIVYVYIAAGFRAALAVLARAKHCLHLMLRCRLCRLGRIEALVIFAVLLDALSVAADIDGVIGLAERTGLYLDDEQGMASGTTSYKAGVLLLDTNTVQTDTVIGPDLGEKVQEIAFLE